MVQSSQRKEFAGGASRRRRPLDPDIRGAMCRSTVQHSHSATATQERSVDRSYDVWGETVNLDSRLESHGLPGEIQVSDAVKEALGDGFVLEPRGSIEVKGVGRMETWLLKAERVASGGAMRA